MNVQLLASAIVPLISWAVIVQGCRAQVELVPSLRAVFTDRGPCVWGPHAELGYAFAKARYWLALRYARLSGEAHYPDEGYWLHDGSQRYGVAGGVLWSAGANLQVRLGAHAEYMRAHRTTGGEWLGWITASEATGIGCGVSARAQYAFGHHFRVWLGAAPGWSFVLAEKALTSSMVQRPITGGACAELLFGITWLLEELPPEKASAW